MKWTAHVVNHARKALARMPRKDRGHIIRALREIEIYPWEGDIEWLKDQKATFRRRVGNWRILFDVHRPIVLL